MDAQLEKEARLKQLHAVGHNHSRDSAIDADMQEWETESFDIDLVRGNYASIYVHHEIIICFAD